jgi:hypothetical protein
MGWISKLLLFLVVLVVATSIVIWVRRAQKRSAFEARLVAWSNNCRQADPNDTIFVLITTATANPSAELLPTLESMFREAYCPQRISTGIVTADGVADKQLLLFPMGDADRESYPYASRFAHQVRFTGAPSGKGAAAARRLGLGTLVLHERYVLLVHSHSSFCAGWDRQMILEHAGAPRRVLTHRGEYSSAPQFTYVQDVDVDSMPLIGARRFQTTPVVAAATIFASSRVLFGLARELVGTNSGVAAPPGLEFAAPHVDDFVLTLSLRVRGFEVVTPIGKTVAHSPPEHVAPRHPWLGKGAVAYAHALLACLLAEDQLARILDNTSQPAASRLVLLQALQALPWVSVALGRACTGPAYLRALDFVAQHAPANEASTDVLRDFRILGARSTAAKALFQNREVRDKSQTALLRVWKEGRRARPGSKEWERRVGTTIDLNAETFQALLTGASVGIGAILDTLGMDPRDASVRWEGALGLGGRKVLPPEPHEIRERFGSQTAFELERSKWQQ